MHGWEPVQLGSRGQPHSGRDFLDSRDENKNCGGKEVAGAGKHGENVFGMTAQDAVVNNEHGPRVQNKSDN
jgi:hypothetical protein